MTPEKVEILTLLHAAKYHLVAPELQFSKTALHEDIENAIKLIEQALEIIGEENGTNT